ncbi:MAG: class I SAM-dependent methyltransferase [Planctomycetota bacterium]|jgi:2-polyprenyl-3-methyl-5-hydroxy-6-metoxy-1,4-benzoquinol methylase
MAIRQQNIKELGDFFDNQASAWFERYHRTQQASDLVILDRMNIAIEFIQSRLAPGSSILDVGCGPGVVALQLVRQGYCVNGIDISRKMIKLCQKAFAEMSEVNDQHAFTMGNFNEIDLEEESFDGIITLGFLEFQEDEIHVLKRFYEILRPGGVLVISGPMRLALMELFGIRNIIRALVFGAPGTDISPPKNYYSLSRLNRLLSQAEFKVLSHKRHGFGSFPFFSKIIGLRAEILLSRLLDNLSIVLPLKAFCSDIIMVAEKR